MKDLNWWLMALSFVLGLAFTAALTVRRVKAVVPESESRTERFAAVPETASAVGLSKVADTEVDDRVDAVAPEPSGVEADTVVIPRAAAGAAAPVGLSKFVEVDDRIDAAAPEPAVGEANTAVIPRDTAGATATDTDTGSTGVGTVAAAGLVGAAAAVGFSKSADTSEADAATTEISLGPYGPGSAKPGADGSGPTGWTVKGNEDSMLYHTPESPSYKQTIAEVWFADEPTAETAGFARWDSTSTASPVAAFAAIPPGPYGEGSAKPGADGSGPTGWTIKGNEDSMLYHTTESPWYKRTIAEVWFADEETAAKAGFEPWHRNKRK